MKSANSKSKDEKTVKSKINKLLSKIPADKEEMRSAYDKLKRSIAGDEKEGKISWAAFIGGLKKNFHALLVSLKSAWRSTLAIASKYAMRTLAVTAASALFLFIILPFLSGIVKKTLSRSICERLIEKASKLITSDPRRCVKLCYLIVRDSLNAAGYPRERNMELFQYGNSLETLNDAIRKDILVIFLLFTKSAYSRDPVSPRDSMEALERMLKVRDTLLNS